jgi:hypothetical protein
VLSTARWCDYRTSIDTEDYEVGDPPLKEPTIRPSEMAPRHPGRLRVKGTDSAISSCRMLSPRASRASNAGCWTTLTLEKYDDSFIYKETRDLLQHRSGPAGAFIQRTSTHSALSGARRQPVDAFTETAWISFRVNHALRIG